MESPKTSDGPADLARAATVWEEPVELTEEDDKRIRRKTDKVILAILVWVYFLQILDKSILGYGAVFGLQEDTQLRGNQYSVVGSIAAMAQLAWQPFSMVLIVTVPHRVLMPSLVLCWGAAQVGMAACRNYAGLLATRFLLGLFEGGCLPLFSIITSQWYRRAEQPLRVAAWYGTNGLATIVASSLSYGLGHIPSETLKSWQIIFLVVGLLTMLSAPFVYWKLDNDIASARFLTPLERRQALARLRTNQTGTGSRELKWTQAVEAVCEPKTYLWVAMSLLLNIGASVANVFGPLILRGLGFDKYITTLLNMPFGATQVVAILASSYAAQKMRLKSAVLVAILVPVVGGLAVLYGLAGARATTRAASVGGYYLLAFLFGGNPLIVAWIVGNTAGTTKKAVCLSLYNAGSSAGNIIGPLLFSPADAPGYRPGLRAVLATFAALALVVLAQAANLRVLNALHRRARVAAGKPARVPDRSMQARYAAGEDDGRDSQQRIKTASQDLTDRQNEDFVYIY
ncbi:hypothetical protein LOZ20_003002 [Ophidiomyces ophidiicola]|uniref:Uncharacterized protein n=1 Tax=Ophidiomyces ophidiicola TaxID=1387563 RepID=A0ACB8UY76_9EURO|nr:hypothetical protein LOZ62_002016 [Ophidiomyces ophidiicola]KAI2196719.1 hypothetical protein LOZ20_003002 [Ophidiomyces ophidiicola]KAI2207802.1 hypothetical protein LOZ17_006737 [Ophidiomyces ophidiicola]KAI2308370.1 hypothetical protein LOY99_002195 [Ophidiomyces ophidiicola]KAI2362538.1 hypothetical protein LOY93_005688 [Ophidiomyces ophidiicola]